LAYPNPVVKALHWAHRGTLCAGLAMAGCAGTDPFSGHVGHCSEAGYTPASQGYAQCMSRRAGPESADERRERQRWEARLERERIAAEQRVRDEQPAVIGMRR